MKKLILFLIFISSLFALDIGDKLPNLVFENQHKKTIRVDGDIKYIIFSAKREYNDVIKEFLSIKDTQFLQNKKAIYLTDISGMPKMIASMFALPKMRKYKFDVYFLNKEGKAYFQGKDISIYSFENSVFKSVNVVKTKDELENFFAK